MPVHDRGGLFWQSPSPFRQTLPVRPFDKACCSRHAPSAAVLQFGAATRPQLIRLPSCRSLSARLSLRHPSQFALPPVAAGFTLLTPVETRPPLQVSALVSATKAASFDSVLHTVVVVVVDPFNSQLPLVVFSAPGQSQHARPAITGTRLSLLFLVHFSLAMPAIFT